MRVLFYIFCLFSACIFYACADDPSLPVADQAYVLRVPIGFPAPEIPENNKLTTARVELGKKLFFDPMLSRDQTISCASCHLQHSAFADTGVLSVGIQGRLGLRNAPTLTNMAYGNHFFFDGGVPSLELQVLAPIHDENEMDFEILKVVERMKADEAYVQMSNKAYGMPPSSFVITRAIAAYERTLISGNSPFDRFFFRGDEDAIDASAKRGWQIFNSEETKCNVCHSGFNFTDQNFYNIGLYAHYPDDGRSRITLLNEDIGKFKVPTLRNVELTAPYMHDGSLPSLEAVLDHFASGGKVHENKSEWIQPFALTDEEKIDLINFLKSLTDEEFIQDETLGLN